MDQQVHVLRLGPARRHGSYRDYKSGLYLTYPEKVVGTVPFGADLTNLYRSVKMRQLEDVNGTVVAEYEASKRPAKAEKKAEAPAAPVEQAAEAELKADEPEEAVAEITLESITEAPAEPKAKKTNRRKK